MGGVRPERAVCILLAAGLSTRYPGDKLMAKLHGRPLLDHAAQTLAAIPFKARIAVVGADQPARWERLAGHGYAIAVNLRPEGGQSGSVREGVAAALAHAPDAVVLALADMPFTPAAHVLALLDALDPADPGAVAYSVAAAADRRWRGPPAAFGAGLLTRLAQTEGDSGARPILAAAPESAGIPAPAAWLADLDAPPDFTSAESGAESGQILP